MQKTNYTGKESRRRMLEESFRAASWGYTVACYVLVLRLLLQELSLDLGIRLSPGWWKMQH